MTKTTPIEYAALRTPRGRQRIANREYAELASAPQRNDDEHIERAAFFRLDERIRTAALRARDESRAKELHARHKRALATNDLDALRAILNEITDDTD